MATLGKLPQCPTCYAKALEKEPGGHTSMCFVCKTRVFDEATCTKCKFVGKLVMLKTGSEYCTCCGDFHNEILNLEVDHDFIV